MVPLDNINKKKPETHNKIKKITTQYITMPRIDTINKTINI
jgi:hypothetical protein